MTKVRLCEISLKETDVSKKSPDTQKKLSQAFSAQVERKIKKAGLKKEFAYVGERSHKDAGHQPVHQVYASRRAREVIREIKIVKKIELIMVSPHALTKTL